MVLILIPIKSLTLPKEVLRFWRTASESYISLVSHVIPSICRAHRGLIITSWWTNPPKPCITLHPTKLHHYALFHVCLSSLMAEFLTFFFFALHPTGIEYLLFSPIGIELASIKPLWLMDENIKVLSPHRSQFHKVILVNLNLSRTSGGGRANI